MASKRRKTKSNEPRRGKDMASKESKENQFAHFVETSRKLGCDEDKERFEKSLGKIAAYKPSKEPVKKVAGKSVKKATRR